MHKLTHKQIISWNCYIFKH